MVCGGNCKCGGNCRCGKSAEQKFRHKKTGEIATQISLLDMKNWEKLDAESFSALDYELNRNDCCELWVEKLYDGGKIGFGEAGNLLAAIEMDGLKCSQLGSAKCHKKAESFSADCGTGYVDDGTRFSYLFKGCGEPNADTERTVSGNKITYCQGCIDGQDSIDYTSLEGDWDAESFNAETCVSCETPDWYWAGGLCSVSGELKCIGCCYCDNCHKRYTEEMQELEGGRTSSFSADEQKACHKCGKTEKDGKLWWKGSRKGFVCGPCSKGGKKYRAESFAAPSHCASCGWNLVQVPIGTETKWGVAIEGNQYYYNHNACKGIGKLPIKAESFSADEYNFQLVFSTYNRNSQSCIKSKDYGGGICGLKDRYGNRRGSYGSSGMSEPTCPHCKKVWNNMSNQDKGAWIKKAEYDFSQKSAESFSAEGLCDICEGKGCNTCDYTGSIYCKTYGAESFSAETNYCYGCGLSARYVPNQSLEEIEVWERGMGRPKKAYSCSDCYDDLVFFGAESFSAEREECPMGTSCPTCYGQGSPYGCGGDYCGWCGTDWKQPCDAECPAYEIEFGYGFGAEHNQTRFYRNLGVGAALVAGLAYWFKR